MLKHLARPLLLHSNKEQVLAGEGQCDCACALAIPTHVTPDSCVCAQTGQSERCICTPHTADELYQFMEPGYAAAINPEWTIMVPGMNRPVLINQAALLIAHHFRQPRHLNEIPAYWQNTWGTHLITETIHALRTTQLLLPVTPSHTTLHEPPTTLTAWLHLTDRCNLRCAYCYLPHKKADMSWEIGLAAVDATIRSALQHGYKTIKLKYAGGEPLLKFSLLADLHQYANQQATAHSLVLDGVVLSNGTLLTEAITMQMRDLGLRLMISLDGLGTGHDRQRFYANGHGSFADVERGVRMALTYGIVPDISVTVSGRNASALPDLTTWLLEKELPFSFNFYRENDLSAALVDLQFEEEAIIQGMLAAFHIIEQQLPRRSLLASLVDRANLAVPHLRTCGVGHSYLVYDYQGRISQCQMHMHQPITTTADEDPLTTIRLTNIGIQNIPVTEKEGCRSCEWKYWCTGGCPLTTYRATGRYDVQSPNCRIYKTIYPEAVRLEGLRLLHYAETQLAHS